MLGKFFYVVLLQVLFSDQIDHVSPLHLRMENGLSTLVGTFLDHLLNFRSFFVYVTWTLFLPERCEFHHCLLSRLRPMSFPTPYLLLPPLSLSGVVTPYSSSFTLRIVLQSSWGGRQSNFPCWCERGHFVKTTPDIWLVSSINPRYTTNIHLFCKTRI